MVYGPNIGTKKLGDFEKGGGKSVLEDGFYKFAAVDFKCKVGKESGKPFVVVDSVVISQEAQGLHCELTFSLSEASERFAYAWFKALGLTDDDNIPVTDQGNLERFLKRSCMNAIFSAPIKKVKRGDYYQNEVSPPWEIALDSETEGDVLPKFDSGDEVPFDV